MALGSEDLGTVPDTFSFSGAEQRLDVRSVAAASSAEPNLLVPLLRWNAALGRCRAFSCGCGAYWGGGPRPSPRRAVRQSPTLTSQGPSECGFACWIPGFRAAVTVQLVVPRGRDEPVPAA